MIRWFTGNTLLLISQSLIIFSRSWTIFWIYASNGFYIILYPAHLSNDYFGKQHCNILHVLNPNKCRGTFQLDLRVYLLEIDTLEMHIVYSVKSLKFIIFWNMCIRDTQDLTITIKSQPAFVLKLSTYSGRLWIFI